MGCAQPLTSRLRTSSSTDSSTSAAQIVVEFDGVDAGGDAVGKSVKKSSKSRQKVEESSRSPKNLKGLKSCKGHRYGGTFTEAPILRQLNTRNSKALIAFRALFARTRRSSLDTTFESIIDKAKLMELLILCHVVPE